MDILTILIESLFALSILWLVGLFAVFREYHNLHTEQTSYHKNIPERKIEITMLTDAMDQLGVETVEEIENLAESMKQANTEKLAHAMNRTDIRGLTESMEQANIESIAKIEKLSKSMDKTGIDSISNINGWQIYKLASSENTPDPKLVDSYENILMFTTTGLILLGISSPFVHFAAVLSMLDLYNISHASSKIILLILIAMATIFHLFGIILILVTLLYDAPILLKWISQAETFFAVDRYKKFLKIMSYTIFTLSFIDYAAIALLISGVFSI
ncbi:hypothetical protein [Natrinema salaciae]|nr:hypothetical protein [Natrinema salaciae]